MEAGGGGAHGHARVLGVVEAAGEAEEPPICWGGAGPVSRGLEAMEREEEEEEEVACECCGFTEECTAPYIAGVRARYGGRWICGLCGDAVGEEIGRASPPISPAEALDRHACVCRRGSAPPSPAESADDLIEALRLLLRRRLGSPPPPRRVRSTPSSPRRDGAIASVPVVAAGGTGAGSSLARTESCFAALVE